MKVTQIRLFAISLSVLSLLICMSKESKAEKEIGNGGHAIVCRNTDGKITSAWLYDLWEAENVRSPRIPIHRIEGLPPFYEDYRIDLIINRLRNFCPLFGIALEMEIEQVRGSMNDVRGVRLELTPDLGIIAHPDGCNVEQLANDTEQPEFKMLRNLDIWEALPETDRSAWYIHEGIYRIYRSLGDKNSEKARKMVAVLFSTTEPNASDYNELSRWTTWINPDVLVENRPLEGNNPYERFNTLSGESPSSITGTWVRVASMNNNGFSTFSAGISNYFSGDNNPLGEIANILSVRKDLSGDHFYLLRTPKGYPIGKVDGIPSPGWVITDPGRFEKVSSQRVSFNISGQTIWVEGDSVRYYECKLQTTELLVCRVYVDPTHDQIRLPGANLLTFRRFPNYFGEE